MVALDQYRGINAVDEIIRRRLLPPQALIPFSVLLQIVAGAATT